MKLKRIVGIVLVYALSLSGLVYAQEPNLEALRSQLAAQQEQIDRKSVV